MTNAEISGLLLEVPDIGKGMAGHITARRASGSFPELEAPRLRASFAEADRIRKKVAGIRLMRSMEIDVLEDGAMDYPDGVLDEIDVVIGSVHSRFQQPAAEMTARIVRATGEGARLASRAVHRRALHGRVRPQGDGGHDRAARLARAEGLLELPLFREAAALARRPGGA